jgi:hypothetical protein
MERQMAQMSKRSDAQHYRIVGIESGKIYATVSYSKVIVTLRQLKKVTDEKLIVQLI